MANVYTIGSEKGYNIVNQLQSGQSTNSLAQEYRPTDGSVWTKNQDGSISVMHNGQQMVGQVTYQPQTQTPATQSGGVYTIGSEKGYNLANGLQAGQSVTATDGSVWTKNANGGIDVMHNGQQMTGQITYQPTSGSGSGSSAQPTGVYTIGSEAGYNIANSLQPGQSTTVTDGSVWTKNADGSISVMHNGKLMTGQITYQPAVSAPVQPTTPTTPTTEYKPITTTPITPGESALVRPSQGENRLTADDIKALYDKMSTQQQEKIDYTVQQAVDELTRAQEDAQKGFADQQNKVNINEAQSRDAQVLYAAARGDRGGITARQYDSISNTAANNRAAINQAQQQLATDTARQIADLRAQGEFEKADALLQIAQQQLAQLWELQQYEDNLLLQEQQMAMQESQLTGQYNGKPTLDFQIANRDFEYNSQLAEREWQQALKEWDYNTAQQEREWAYEIAMQSIQAGIVPDASTLAAAGITAATASQMASIYKASLTAKSSSGGGGGGGTKTSDKVSLTVAQNMAEMGQFTPEVLQAFYDAGYTDQYLYEMYGYEPETADAEKELTVDMQSVLALGYGPIGADELARLVAAGEIREYVVGNLIKYAKVGAVDSSLRGANNPNYSNNRSYVLTK